MKNYSTHLPKKAKIPVFTAMITGLICCCAIAADSISFLNGDKLNGEVITLDEDTLTIKHPSAKSILKIRSSKVYKISFASTSKSIEQKNINLAKLSNGDTIQCELSGVTQDSFIITNHLGDTVELPKQAVSAFFFNSSLPVLLFSNSEGQPPFKNNRGWITDDDEYIGYGDSNMWQQFDLSRDYIIHLNANIYNNPKFSLFFSASNTNPLAEGDKYSLDLSSEGLSLKRKTKKNSIVIRKINRGSLNYKNIGIELRVSRSRKEITLILNGKNMGTYPDARAATSCNGNVIGMMIEQNNNAEVSISNFTIKNWNGQTAYKQILPEQDKIKSDFLTDKLGNRRSGQLVDIRGIDEQKSIVFKNPHAENNEEIIPIKFAEILHVMNSSHTAALQQESSKLKGGGSLQLTNISISGDHIIAQHPVLGECKFLKDSFNSLVITPKQAQKKADTKSSENVTKETVQGVQIHEKKIIAPKPPNGGGPPIKLKVKVQGIDEEIKILEQDIELKEGGNKNE